MWYSHGLAGATAFRRQITQLDGLAELMAECARFFAHAEGDTDRRGEAMPFDEKRALG